MGTRCTVLLMGLMSGLSLSASETAHAQTKNSSHSARNAYYQPLTKQEYQQHVNTAYFEKMAEDDGKVESPALPAGDQFLHQDEIMQLTAPRPDRIASTLQERATRLLNRQQARARMNPNAFGNSTSSIPSAAVSTESGAIPSVGISELSRFSARSRSDEGPNQAPPAPTKESELNLFAEPPGSDELNQLFESDNGGGFTQSQSGREHGESGLESIHSEASQTRLSEEVTLTTEQVFPREQPLPQESDFQPTYVEEVAEQTPNSVPAIQVGASTVFPTDNMFPGHEAENSEIITESPPLIYSDLDNATTAPAQQVPTAQPFVDPNRHSGSMSYHRGAPMMEAGFARPTGSQNPVFQQPAYQQPEFKQPTYQQPTYQQPTYQQPTYQQPEFKKSATRQSVVQERVFEKPPIVQSSQVPGEIIPWNVPPKSVDPPENVEPEYVLDYQPIPGLSPETEAVISQQVPVPPGAYVPAPAGTRNAVVSNQGIYTEVIDESTPARRHAPVRRHAPARRHGKCKTCDTSCPENYFSVYGGFSGLRQLRGMSGQRSISVDDGAAFGLALGRRVDRNLRTEVEFSYRHHDVGGLMVFPIPASGAEPVAGDVNSYAGMANLYWEFMDAPTRCFKPYLGAGIGFISVDADFRNSMSQNIAPPGYRNDSSLAYQWMAGLNYKAYRNVDLFVEYRFLQADAYRIAPQVPGLGDRYNLDTDNVFFGFRRKY